MLKKLFLEAFADRLPAGVRRDLVAMLYTTRAPLIMVGAIGTLVGAIVAVRLESTCITLVTAILVVWTIVRVALLGVFRKRATRSRMDGTEVRFFERAYASGSIGTGLLLGGMNYTTLRGEDAGLHMLMSALIFGYAAGLVVRVSVRPIIHLASLTAAILPSVAGLLLHVGERSDHGVPYGATALVYCAFALASIESARFLHRSTVNQLITARALADLANQDVLTGLANRLLLRERLHEGIEAISKVGDLVALHLLDLDRFKPVNDRYGHPTGDAVLKAVADRLSTLIRAGDTVARTGGDEFAIVQIGIEDVSQAQALAYRIVEALAKPFRIGSTLIHIGTSVGIAFAPRDGVELDGLSLRADSALYAAKGRGRGTVAIWDQNS
jgi:diguanylate cyclase (GGDEF)-like protein